jgi:1,4-alpha-glucan branching enzyme
MRYKMPGDDWQRFANLRLLYTYQFTHPGKKLLFMGCEFGQGPEWSHDQALDWYVLEHTEHRGLQSLVQGLNQLYHNERCLYHDEVDWHGFEWIDCHDADQSILTYLRKAGDDFVLVALNVTPIPRHGYRIGVPRDGYYREIFNSDAQAYGGSNAGNLGGIQAEAVPWMGRPYSIYITLPPLAGVVFKAVT